MIDSTATASVSQGIHMPDYFSCRDCPAGKYHYGELCNDFQRAGRCRAALLGQALNSGAVQVHLHIAPAALPAGGVE